MNIMEKLGFSKRPNTGTRNTVKEEPRISLPKGFILKDSSPRKEGEKRLYNLIILDESGSMDRIRIEALTGANETIQSIKSSQEENPEDNQMLSLVTFDTRHGYDDIRAIVSCKPIQEVNTLMEKDYRPYGCTPLYDAMGFSIQSMKENVQDGDSVLVTVITDGLENSSSTFSASMVKELVDGLREKGWMFTYIGANQDSVEQAGELGIQAAMDFEATGTGARMMYDKMNSSHRAYYKKSRAFRAGKISFSALMDASDFFSEKASASRVTPEHIESLETGEIFVFGSNPEGIHNGGAARVALEKFGAIMGQGEGLQGQSYAIPTTFGSVEEIKPYIRNFILFADANPNMKFLVTRIGCGVAGFKDEEIAPLFAGAQGLPNVNLPESFWKVINYKYSI